jgi:ectoine hydroxylase-related dioxygenase (phytanoyl-CoA dioxygenase family)
LLDVLVNKGGIAMPVEHLQRDAAPEKLAELLARDGCVVIDNLVEPTAMDGVLEEMTPYIESVAAGIDEFTGKATKRVGALVARSPKSHELIMNPTILGTARKVLAKSKTIQLHLTQIIAIGGGQGSQGIHRDQWAFDFFPFPKGYEIQCNTIWAMTDFSEANGATRVIPGSHLGDDKQRFVLADTEAAEMEKGSVFLYTGAVYHGGGANKTDQTRYGLNITYNASWLRQEENQYLSCPREIARELPEDLLRIMGYERGAYALGYIDDLRDPIEALGISVEDTGFGDLERVREHVGVIKPDGSAKSG